jgi:hypothetical protein
VSAAKPTTSSPQKGDSNMQVNRSARFKASWLAVVLLISFNLGAVQEAAAQEAAQPQQTPSGGVRLDPSMGPLTPGEPQSRQPAATQAPLPDAPQPQQPAQSATQSQQQAVQQPAPPEPLGAAAAEQIKTAGGGASRPAGNAIAPAKQHQYRSMLIKLGAVAAAGIAVGTVYGLSRATPSVPPHSAGATK